MKDNRKTPLKKWQKRKLTKNQIVVLSHVIVSERDDNAKKKRKKLNC